MALSYRGRLLGGQSVEIARLDPAVIAAGDNYDADFRESRIEDPTGDRIGRGVRRELPAVRLPCQVETQAWDALEMTQAGAAPRTRVTVVLHFEDLERAGLVDGETGEAAIRPGDRVVAFYDRRGRLIERVRTPPGLYVVEAQSIASGLGGQRNLLALHCEDRALRVGA